MKKIVSNLNFKNKEGNIFTIQPISNSVMVGLEPIPITSNQLNKLGFTKYGIKTEYDSIYEYKKNDINISIGFYKDEIHTFLYSGDCLNHIVYLHQLQNLFFALTGEEFVEIK